MAQQISIPAPVKYCPKCHRPGFWARSCAQCGYTRREAPTIIGRMVRYGNGERGRIVRQGRREPTSRQAAQVAEPKIDAIEPIRPREKLYWIRNCETGAMICLGDQGFVVVE